MTDEVRILLVSGSLRSASTNTAVLRTAAAVAPRGVVAVLYDGLRSLPPFDPDDEAAPPPEVIDLRAQIHAAGAIVFCTPEYAGALPGAFKNLLDWLIGDDQPGSIYEKPVAWFNASPRGAELAHESLRVVLGYAHAHIVESACVHVSVTQGDVDAESGLVERADVRGSFGSALHELAADVAASVNSPRGAAS